MRTFNIFLLLLVVSGSLHAMDIYDEISNAIRSGDSRQIALYFGNSIDLTLVNQEDVYSKAQAEQIIKDFLSKNTPKSFTIIHKGSSKEGTLYAVGTLVTTTGKAFRTSFFIKMMSGKYMVRELRFETE